MPILTTVSSRNRIDGYAGCGSVECDEFALLAEGTCLNASEDDVLAAPGEAPAPTLPGPGPAVVSLVVVITGGGTRNESTGEMGVRPLRPDAGDAVERGRYEAGRADTDCTR